MNRKGISVRNLLALLLLPVMLVGAGCTRHQKEARFQVVTSIMPLKYFAERIGGRHVSVSVMVPPGGDPHSYEPAPKQMVKLSKALLFIKAGSGIEFELDWMPRFLSLNPGLLVCDASRGVKLIPLQDGDDRAEEHHDHEEASEHHHHGGLDPHYWLSASNGIVIARNTAVALETIDPEHKAEYAANAEKLISELASLDSETKKKIAAAKQKKFLVFHPAWGYYARDYGLEQIAVEAEGKTLTPRQMQHVIDTARQNRIRAVFISPQFNSAQADAIASAIGGYTLAVDPLAEDYPGNIRHTTDLFLKTGNE